MKALIPSTPLLTQPCWLLLRPKAAAHSHHGSSGVWLLCAIDGAVSLLLPGLQWYKPVRLQEKKKKSLCLHAALQSRQLVPLLCAVCELRSACVFARLACFGTSRPELHTFPSPPSQRCSELSAKFQESIFRNQSASSTLVMSLRATHQTSWMIAGCRSKLHFT